MAVYNHFYPDSNNQINTTGSRASLMQAGPTIPVTVGPAEQLIEALTKLNLPIPTPVSGLALIDTGASICMVDEAALQSLSLKPTGYQPLSTPSGLSTQPTYFASLSFPGTPIPNITFTDFAAGPLAQQGIIAIIGRNVLAYFVMVYNGVGGQITLTF